jgi:hypothetical protein
MLSRCAGFGFAELSFASVPHCVRQHALRCKLNNILNVIITLLKIFLKKTEILHLFFIFD